MIKTLVMKNNTLMLKGDVRRCVLCATTSLSSLPPSLPSSGIPSPPWVPPIPSLPPSLPPSLLSLVKGYPAHLERLIVDGTEEEKRAWSLFK
jgi:hypothetical protein